MTTLILTLIFLLIFTAILRANYQKNTILSFSYKFYALRDKLRQYSIEGKINKNLWAFDFLDESISRTITELPKINIFTTISLGLIYRNDKKMSTFKNLAEKEFEKNVYLRQINKEYSQLLFSYIIVRHFSILTMMKGTIWSILNSAKLFKFFKDKLKLNVLNLRFFPETSSTANYC